MAIPDQKTNLASLREVDENVSRTEARESLALPQETIEACVGLGRVLQKIRARLVSEGYNFPE